MSVEPEELFDELEDELLLDEELLEDELLDELEEALPLLAGGDDPPPPPPPHPARQVTKRAKQPRFLRGLSMAGGLLGDIRDLGKVVSYQS